jgi:hypothetical protein
MGGAVVAVRGGALTNRNLTKGVSKVKEDQTTTKGRFRCA